MQGLHTSCSIERCKEHSQFQRFRACESRVIPFSALEMALASRKSSVSREEALQEIRSALGFRDEPVCEYRLIQKMLEEKA